MPTNRQPIRRPPRGPTITGEAIATFRRMYELEYVCDCGGDPKARCAPCKEYFRLDSKLCDLLKLKPWEFPAVRHPDADGEPDHEARARYRALAKAAGIAL